MKSPAPSAQVAPPGYTLGSEPGLPTALAQGLRGR